MRHASLLRGLSDAPRDFIDDDIVVRGVAADQTAKADYRIVFLRRGESASRGRNLECAGNADGRNAFGCCAAAQQSIEGASKQSFGDELVKPRDDDAKTFSGSAEIAFNRVGPKLGRRVRRRPFFLVFLRDSVPPW